MALIQVNFSSSSLKRMVPIQVILPVEKLEGAAKLISMLEDKADFSNPVPAARCHGELHGLGIKDEHPAVGGGEGAGRSDALGGQRVLR